MSRRWALRLSPRTTTLVALLAGVLLLPALGALVWQRLAPAPCDEPLTFRIDINRADAAELALLPGVGPALAARIIDDRSKRGDFENVAALRRVKGIGGAISQGVAPFVRVDLTTR